MKLKIQVLNILNRLFFFKNLELLRIIKNGHDKKYQALKTKKTYLDINGKISYVVDKRLNYNDKQIENYKLFLSKYILKQPVETIFNILLYENESKSQYRQDLFVLSELEFKRDGFFVEFGATNGINGSNSFILEKNFGWKGILAEPAKEWHDALDVNRNCTVEKDCVWTESNIQLVFLEQGVLSTINAFADNDQHERKSNNKYLVNTISLNDLLEKHKAPMFIDYLSIDTEGSEFEILKSLNFNKYKISIITVEHNHTKMRNQIYKLLSKKGYSRVYEEISYCDDWYILTNNNF